MGGAVAAGKNAEGWDQDLLRREVENEIGTGLRRWPSGCGHGGLGREAKVAQNALHDRRIFDGGDEAQASAADAGEDVDFEDAAQQLGPRERAARGRSLWHGGRVIARRLRRFGRPRAGDRGRPLSRPSPEDAVIDEA